MAICLKDILLSGDIHVSKNKSSLLPGGTSKTSLVYYLAICLKQVCFCPDDLSKTCQV